MTLPLTGERTVPGIATENYWFRRHEAAYRLAAVRCRGLDVLDAGCGEGYGTARLAASARRVLGVELVAEVVAHARRAYPGVAFARADVCALPVATASLDAVVSLQVVEHLWDIPRYLAEVARVLRPGGLFVCATPNRLTFTPAGAPANPFHSVEFTAAELAALLAGRFAAVRVLGVAHGPRLVAAERERGCSLAAAQHACPPQAWPPWLDALVRSVTADDFAVVAGPGSDVDASLDLLALARTPGVGKQGRGR